MMLVSQSSGRQRLGALIRLIRRGCMVVMAMCVLLLCGCGEQDVADDILVAVSISDETSSEPEDSIDASDLASSDDGSEGDPAHTDPAETDTAETDATEVDPAEADATEANPAETDIVDPDLARSEYNPYDALSVPTQFIKLGELYFIVDCYHDQVIYTSQLGFPLRDWKIMTSDIQRGHTVASDGELYLVDDTEHARVLVFTYDGTSFVQTQIVENVGIRPHYIVYNDADACFYVWSSMTGEMCVFERDGDTDQVRLNRVMAIKELNGVYVRSFTIVGDSIYLVSGNCQILEARRSDFTILHRYAVPESMAGMIQIMPVSGGYYITVSTDASGNQDCATILYTKSLSDLASGAYTDVYSNFIGIGTPYYIGVVDGRMVLTEHRIPGYSIWMFDIGENGLPVNVEVLY